MRGNAARYAALNEALDNACSGITEAFERLYEGNDALRGLAEALCNDLDEAFAESIGSGEFPEYAQLTADYEAWIGAPEAPGRGALLRRLEILRQQEAERG